MPDIFVKCTYLQDPRFNLPHWYRLQIADYYRHMQCMHSEMVGEPLGDVVALAVEAALNKHIPYPALWVRYRSMSLCSRQRFSCHRDAANHGIVTVHDHYLYTRSEIPVELLSCSHFDLPNTYACNMVCDLSEPSFTDDDLEGELASLFSEPPACRFRLHEFCEYLSLCATIAGHSSNTIAALQRNFATVKDFKRSVPESTVVIINVNGHSARALLDSGSMADFISTKLVHQLGIQPFELAKQLPIYLAIQGSRAKVSAGCSAEIHYQTVKEAQYFDVVNLLNYDLVLGIPFLYQ